MVPVSQHRLGLQRGRLPGLELVNGAPPCYARMWCPWLPWQAIYPGWSSASYNIFHRNTGMAAVGIKLLRPSSVVVHTRGVQCDSSKGRQFGIDRKALWSGQVVRLATYFSWRPENVFMILSIHIQAASRCARFAPGSNKGYQQKCADFVTRTSIQGQSLNSRHQNRKSRLPDFWHKESGEKLLFNNCCEPAWGDSELNSLNAEVDYRASATFPWCSNQADQLIGPESERRSILEFVKKLCQQGHVKGAVEALEVLVGMNFGIDKYLLHSVLKECVVQKDMILAGKVHALAIKMGFGSDTFLCNHFIRTYASHGKLQEAMDVFKMVAMPDASMWFFVISAHVKQGQAKRAIELYQQLRATRVKLSGCVLVAALQACAAVRDLASGKHVHNDVLMCGMEHNKFVCNCLVNMYAKCGSLKDARRVFDCLGEKDVVTWNAIIAGYARVQGLGQEALILYTAMHNEGKVTPDIVTFVCLFQACANVGVSALEKGRQLHTQLRRRRFEFNVVVGRSLMNMYVKCGSLPDARVVFDVLGEKNVGTWNAMIAGYSHEGMAQEALELYSVMQSEGMVAPNAVTYVCLLQACANAGVSALANGKLLHLQIQDRRLESDVVVGGSLVNMYVKCGSLLDARYVFDGLTEKNVVTWTAMIAGYAQQDSMGQEALSLYSIMQSQGMVAPNAVTFICLLQACANVGVLALENGKQVHAQLKDRRLESDFVLGRSLVDMYVKCGSIEDARIVFNAIDEKDVVTWNAMISGYAQLEDMAQEALALYNVMRNEGIVAPNAVTFVYLLQACATVGVLALESGKQLHSQLKHLSLSSDVILGGSLVNMYVKCGSLEDARTVFDGLGEKNVVTWNAMISGYAQQERLGQEALNMYSSMGRDCLSIPNAVTYVCLLEACASIGALQQGKQLHSEVRDRGFESNVFIGTCLVKMYAKCGRLDVSREVFDRLPVKSLVSWNVLLKGYAEHGEGDIAIQSFEELLKQGVKPSRVTYTCLFTACSHAGLVDQGQQYFATMLEQHGVEPDDQLYCCMVDLFGRSGHLDKAEQMLRASGLAGSAVSWKALLSACKCYGDIETGRRCFEHLVKLEPTVATSYVLLSSIYAQAGRWDEVDSVESLRLAAGARKLPGKAGIEVKGEVHEFTVGEDRADAAATSRKMNTRVKEGGHVPQTQVVLRAVSEQEKEDALCGHAEKLALAYGLLNTPIGSALVVTKNLRMCNDCHSSTKIMSRLEKREIVVRDGHKVHRFQNGACSCQDRP